MIKKAVVLAAGLGTRLRPFTCAVPKPMMPVWGEPMVARIVAALKALGVEEIAVNSHYLHEQVDVWAAANGCRTSFEPEILGTGGVLNPLREWLAGDDFYLVNGDIVVDGLEKWQPKIPEGCIGTALVSSTLGPRTVEVEPESGFVTCWKSPDPGYNGTYTYLGIAALKNGILDYVAPAGFSSIIEAYEKAMMDGKFVKAEELDGLLWTDAGTIESYMAVNEDQGDNAFAAIPQLAKAAAAGLDLTGLKFLGARGSDRCFFRTGNSVIVVYDDAKRPENARYAGHTRFLAAAGIPVPELKLDLPADKTLALGYAGESGFTLERYVKVVETLAKFNALDTGELELEKPFDRELYTWEHSLFAEHCLNSRFLLEMPPAVAAELGQIAEFLSKLPLALVHRDFQSTNILWDGEGKLAIIDYQGMRKGPAAYDLASLLYDPYIELGAGERRALAKLYAKASGNDGILKALPYAACQRLVQCLGAYGRLASVGQHGFCKYVEPALVNLLEVADEAGMDALAGLAETLIAKEHARHHHHGGHCRCGEHHHG